MKSEQLYLFPMPETGTKERGKKFVSQELGMFWFKEIRRELEHATAGRVSKPPYMSRHYAVQSNL